jgi:hypothetical protein
MKLREQVYIRLFVINLFLTLSAVPSVIEGEETKEKQDKLLTTRNSFDIRGVVVDITPDIYGETIAKLEHAAKNSEEEFDRIFDNMYCVSSPVSNIIVAIKCRSFIKKNITDSQGRFAFYGLPKGEYEIVTEMSPMILGKGVKQMEGAPCIVNLYKHQTDLTLTVRSDIIKIKGRIMDSKGQPIKGVKVIGVEKYDDPQNMYKHKEVSVVSDENGFYELNGFTPLDILSIALYLMGGDPSKHAMSPFYIKIHVKADGFVQTQMM